MQKFVDFVQQALGNVAAKTACPGVVGGWPQLDHLGCWGGLVIGPGVCRLVNVGVFQPGGLCMGFLCVCVCVPRMENQQKKACVIQEWSHAKLLVGDLCRGFYYRKIISGRIDSIHPGISRYMNIALVQACSMGTLIVVQASPVFFSCVCVWLGTTLYQLLGTNQMYGFPCAMIGPTRP